MKISFILPLSIVALLFSCTASVSNKPDANTQSPNALKDGVLAAPGKTINTTEIFEKEYSLKENIQFNNATQKNLVITEKEVNKEVVRFSLFMQNDKKVKPENIDNAKPYCEIYIQLAANQNADNIIFKTSEDNLIAHQFSVSEKSNRINSDITSSAQFRIGFAGKPVSADKLKPMLHLACFDVTNYKELVSHIGSAFLILDKPDLKP